jgi:hypothetical protein
VSSHFARPALLLTAALLALTSACLPAAATVEPTATASAVPTATHTVIWFPPTATPTPPPTRAAVTATPPPPLELGAALLSDDFSRPSGWTTGHIESGSVAYGENELTLAVDAKNASLLSLREAPELTDFYLQVTASPSLCQQDDQYGVLFRASSAGDAYRLLATCSGRLRLERLLGGQASVVRDWITSSQIMPNMPASYRIGIWAKGSQIRVYINDVFELEAREPVHSKGGLGLYARQMGSTALTVSFSDLQVNALD